MNLLQLAPDIQESILLLPNTVRGKDPIQEHQIRPIAATPDWGKQRQRRPHPSNTTNLHNYNDRPPFGFLIARPETPRWAAKIMRS
ncbi:MAG: hypothetical protein NTY87_13195 [Planctomycetia bacterium]|nr:hypothetical protein [Planctomycetia bacterium]